jgi:hypothetical protein
LKLPHSDSIVNTLLSTLDSNQDGQVTFEVSALKLNKYHSLTRRV